jgi:hypothetical protein
MRQKDNGWMFGLMSTSINAIFGKDADASFCKMKEEVGGRN